MAKNKFNKLFVYLISIIVLSALAFLILRNPFSSSEKDFLIVENTCKNLRFQEWDTISPTIVNTGKHLAYVKTCLSSEQFTFENYKHSFCLEENKIQPFNSSIQQEIKIDTDPEFAEAQKASIQVEMFCKKHFLFFKRGCGTINYTCRFDKISALDLMG